MKKYIIFIIMIIVVLGTIFLVKKGNSQGIEKNEENKQELKKPAEPKYDISTHIVEEDETFAIILENFDIDYGEMMTILDSASSTYDLTRIRVGQPLRLARDNNGNNTETESHNYRAGKNLRVGVLLLTYKKYISAPDTQVRGQRKKTRQKDYKRILPPSDRSEFTSQNNSGKKINAGRGYPRCEYRNAISCYKLFLFHI